MTWICKIICFFIGHKWTDWWDIIDDNYRIKCAKFCLRCGKCEEKK